MKSLNLYYAGKYIHLLNINRYASPILRQKHLRSHRIIHKQSAGPHADDFSN